MEFHYEVSGNDFARAGLASSEIKKTLQRLGLPHEVIKRVAVAMYEAEINMVVHAGGGVADVRIDKELITIIMCDKGPGIEDLSKAMEDGYSTASEQVRELGFGAGMGMSNMKKNADEMYIDTAKGKGTCVTLKIRIPEHS
ncbi:MAG: ATP-binding protein [Spirochaetales bacterium]|nr:ATP-binding protein [Spirochaetales bacterium]